MPLTKIKSNITDIANIADAVENENLIINGSFNIWQRATSQTSTGYGSDDRWNNVHTGTTKTHSRQAFTLGQIDVPYEPVYYSRTVVTSVAGANNHCIKAQFIESVRTLAGQTVTLSFYAKADTIKNIALEFYQTFGTGGAPSATVEGIGVTTFTLTTSWQKFTTTVSIPSISGKTLGTNNNDYLAMLFWFDAGSSFNSRTNSLGQQSGTFDIAQVQLESGNTATPFKRKKIGEELMLCQRYYETGSNALLFWSGDVSNTGTYYLGTAFKVTKRSAAPIITYTNISNSGFPNSLIAGQVSYDGFRTDATANATTAAAYFRATWTADAELQ